MIDDVNLRTGVVRVYRSKAGNARSGSRVTVGFLRKAGLQPKAEPTYHNHIDLVRSA